MKPTVLGIIIVLALLATGAIFYGGSALTPSVPAPVLQSYSNDVYGISFSYPTGYLLSENELGTPGQEHHVITIVHEDEAVPRVNSEGPTAITIDFYKTSATLEQWLASPASNLALGDGKKDAILLDGTEATVYGWSGLYEGYTTAILHEGYVIAFSVTYMSPSDALVGAYTELLGSVRLR